MLKWVFTMCLLTGSMVLTTAIDVTVLNCNADKSVTLKVVNAQGKFVSMDYCTSTEGENSGLGLASNDEDVTFTTCNLAWGAKYLVHVTVHKDVIEFTDFRKYIFCALVDSEITVQAGATVSPPTAGASIKMDVKPTANMRINEDPNDHLAAAITTVKLGTPLTLHIRLDDEFISTAPDMDIQAAIITVTNGGGATVTLTGNPDKGCKSKDYWAEVTDEGIGYLKVQFKAFMFTKAGSPLDKQLFTASLEVCAEIECPNFACGLPPSRRKREVDNATIFDDIEVRSLLNVVSYEIEVDGLDGTDNGGQLPEEKAGDSDLCIKRPGFYGLITAFFIALLLSVAVSRFLFLKARSRRRNQMEEQLFYKNSFGASNASFRR